MINIYCVCRYEEKTRSRYYVSGVVQTTSQTPSHRTALSSQVTCYIFFFSSKFPEREERPKIEREKKELTFSCLKGAKRKFVSTRKINKRFKLASNRTSDMSPSRLTGLCDVMTEFHSNTECALLFTVIFL